MDPSRISISKLLLGVVIIALFATQLSTHRTRNNRANLWIQMNAKEENYWSGVGLMTEKLTLLKLPGGLTLNVNGFSGIKMYVKRWMFR